MISNLTRPTRSLHNIRTSDGLRTLGRTTTVALVGSHAQRRGFKFSEWSSVLEPESYSDLRRRLRSQKRKDIDSMHRILSWDKHPLGKQASLFLRQMADDGFWRMDKEPQISKKDSVRSKTTTPDNPTGVRPGANIEDVERDAFEDLFFGSHHSESPSFATPEVGTPRTRGKRSRNRHSSHKAAAATTVLEPAIVESDYVIDPITNRKVPKVQAKTSIDEAIETTPTAERKIYRSQFAQFEPPAAPEPTPEPIQPYFPDGPPPPSELRGYRDVDVHTTDSFTSTTGGIDSSAPVFESDEYIKDLAAHPIKPPSIRWAPDGAGMQNLDADRAKGLESSLERYLAEYKDLDKYRPVMDDAAVPEDPSAGYGDLDQYKPVMGKEEAPVPREEYEDLHKYKPVLDQGAPAPVAAEEYRDLDKYKPVMDPAAPVAEDPAAEYKDLDSYQPVKHNEPDGKPVDYVEQEVYEDLPKYKAFMYNEPDGKPPGHTEESAVYDAAELGKYEAFRYNEPDGKPVVLEAAPADLSKYGPVRHNEPDGKPPSQSDKPPAAQPPKSTLEQLRELSFPGCGDWSQPRRERFLMDVAEQVDARARAEELAKYSAPVTHNEPDGKPEDRRRRYEMLMASNMPGDYEWSTPRRTLFLQDIAESMFTPEEIRMYSNPVRHNEPDGKAPEAVDDVAKGLEDFDAEFSKTPYVEPTPEKQAEEDLDSLRASDVRSSVLARAEAAASEEKPARRYSGVYARDFPEDFEGSWTATLTGLAREQAMKDPYSTTPQGLETSYAEEIEGKSTWPTHVRTYGTLASGSEQQSPANQSTSASGTGSSAHSSSSSGTPNDDAAATQTELETPAKETLYKILAYDPAMQTVSVAETSSTVPDATAALPPAEALLRLSNPTKFLPHFAPLQAEGFEIVSGGGDVLVFRKKIFSSEESMLNAFRRVMKEEEPSAAVGSPVNPIDMTGAAAHHRWAYFTSPTGYVSYDPEPVDTSRLPPPPAYQGHRIGPFGQFPGVNTPHPGYGQQQFEAPRAEEETGKRAEKKDPRGRTAKRVLIGATWVAGVSYALGVVGEYFKTGGTEGKGPKGL